MQAIRPDAALVAIHDSARPLVQADDVQKCLLDALQATPCPFITAKDAMPLQTVCAGA